LWPSRGAPWFPVKLICKLVARAGDPDEKAKPPK
jgi:hypothetical protein